ncbi:hypothetical protein N7462_008957 [Penicillium macrosclerotiorum]|uniref:uncharacterized protein n=1 Tax=Penicillium macrosclerotiorum TaxID=303699 RepID=UPI002547916A|nr:uncharacterized protein N7462_008957 [Penicillium macrosclerotiorum]KAJ5676060.1 hypothetical protein N7462_008957 [Penicillium macrosclerotiorum]
MEIEDPISVDLSLENSTIATSSSYVASFTTGDNIEGTAIIRSRANEHGMTMRIANSSTYVTQ